ncbi:MAG: hypothetical protein KC414_14895, partial [Romboutsia sp.]|nr:hypothetical protein [Romboutsia sp.]
MSRSIYPLIRDILKDNTNSNAVHRLRHLMIVKLPELLNHMEEIKRIPLRENKRKHAKKIAEEIITELDYPSYWVDYIVRMLIEGKFIIQQDDAHVSFSNDLKEIIIGVDRNINETKWK